jgi:hypothetical protein
MTRTQRLISDRLPAFLPRGGGTATELPKNLGCLARFGFARSEPVSDPTSWRAARTERADRAPVQDCRHAVGQSRGSSAQVEVSPTRR